jgi:hypothetical protein
MISGIFEAICRVGIFMICAQAVINFRPNASYEKYLKLLMGVMVLILILKPVINIFTDSGNTYWESESLWSSGEWMQNDEIWYDENMLSVDELQEEIYEETQKLTEQANEADKAENPNNDKKVTIPESESEINITPINIGEITLDET